MRIAINGFGRIGRTVFKKIINDNELEVAIINDLADAATLAHLLKYDSVHGIFEANIETGDNKLIVNGKEILLTREKEPQLLPHAAHAIDLVVESTGKFANEEGANKHLQAGAKRVVISAPANGNLKSIVLGVNHHLLDGSEKIISNASCTTNSAAPMLKILQENFGIESAYITTVHSMTGDQNLHDAPHKDLRRARSAPTSIIPTTTGAAKALNDIFPELSGKLGGAGIRVPVINGSLTDITCILTRNTTVSDLNALFKNAASIGLKGILEYTEDPIVSIDIVGNTHSCIYDAQLTNVLGNMVKIVGWYDNEMGYSSRLYELIKLLQKKIPA